MHGRDIDFHRGTDFPRFLLIIFLLGCLFCPGTVFLIAATRRDLATNVHFRVQHRDARQGVPEHPWRRGNFWGVPRVAKNYY
eukprot:1159031-Pelagomonas_calceolata.AAC.1